MSNDQRPAAPQQAAGTYPQPGYPQGFPVRPPNPSALARKALACGIAAWVVSVLTIVGAVALVLTARAMRDASGLGWIGFVAPMVILPALIVLTVMGFSAGAQGMAYASTPREFTMSKLGKRLSVTHWILLALAFGAEWIREMVNYYMRHPG